MRILANTRQGSTKKQNKIHILRQFGKKSQHNLSKSTKKGARDAFFIFYRKC